MNLYGIGNMNTHLRTTELKTMWNLRRKNNDYSSKGQLRLDQMFEQMYGKNGQDAHGNDTRLQEIQQKLYYGGKLTPDEMEYLKAKNPQAYNELVKEEQEQKAFERDLRRCETKEDVERLKMNKINGALSTISSVENNPNIPKMKKLEIIMKAKRMIDNAMESVAKFVKSGEFAKLPTEAEETQARKEAAEQTQTEQEKIPVQKDEAEAEELQQPETDKTTAETTANTKPKPEVDVESPEERKVRRAKAKAAYTALSPDFEPQRGTAKLDRNA